MGENLDLPKMVVRVYPRGPYQDGACYRMRRLNASLKMADGLMTHLKWRTQPSSHHVVCRGAQGKGRCPGNESKLPSAKSLTHVPRQTSTMQKTLNTPPRQNRQKQRRNNRGRKPNSQTSILPTEARAKQQEKKTQQPNLDPPGCLRSGSRRSGILGRNRGRWHRTPAELR
ncbi:Hypothetical predicted protein [Podarcis lilfordi]|uniref:Uncharacterized protein n=1 Tax=Podarcis lilfordi TaxID=74358 RepID=A0AA35P5R8_9SAUR|nr:Hypothetical predicted protein [Podarcis lilfordi]